MLKILLLTKMMSSSVVQLPFPVPLTLHLLYNYACNYLVMFFINYLYVEL